MALILSVGMGIVKSASAERDQGWLHCPKYYNGTKFLYEDAPQVRARDDHPQIGANRSFLSLELHRVFHRYSYQVRSNGGSLLL